jgi:Leucine-rich repeat (LRR) protein
MIKKYNQFIKESNQDIDSICKKYGIENYTINEDGTIDVDGDVNLTKLTKLPLKFRNVSGDFYCSNNRLTTLEGCPQTVGGDFSCSSNQLTTLEGGPKSVGGYFSCYNNQLTTLEGCPQTVGGDFDCSSNQLTTLEGGPKSVGGYFNCHNNNIKDFRGFPEFWEGEVNFASNPVQSILDEFPKNLWSKVIYWINEYDVIHDGNVIEDRLDEVKYQLGINI